MVIAFDGLASSGKSSLSKGLAKILGYNFCSAGAIYRAIALKICELKINEKDIEKIGKMLENTDIRLEYKNGIGSTILDGKDVSLQICSPEVSEFTPKIAKFIIVREYVRKIQHAMGDNQNIVIEGRDIGTVVFPNADIKFYMIASDEVRAKRRMKDFELLNKEVSFEEVLKSVRQRDYNDINRKFSPLKKADDAIVFDNTYLTYEEALQKLVKVVKEKLGCKI